MTKTEQLWKDVNDKMASVRLQMSGAPDGPTAAWSLVDWDRWQSRQSSLNIQYAQLLCMRKEIEDLLESEEQIFEDALKASDCCENCFTRFDDAGDTIEGCGDEDCDCHGTLTEQDWKELKGEAKYDAMRDDQLTED